MNDFQIFEAGTVFYPLENVPKQVMLSHESIDLEFPTRLCATLLDTAAIAPNKKKLFPAGSISVSVDNPIRVKTTYLGNDNGFLIISDGTKRKSLTNHAYQIMCRALENTPSLNIDVNEGAVPNHCGFGSSGAVLGAVCSSINELYGSPINNIDLIRYIASNYGEEVIDGDKDNLKVIPCTGTSLTTGLSKGGVQIVSGIATLIGASDYHGNAVIGIPSDYKPFTAEVLTRIEMIHFNVFNSAVEIADHVSLEKAYQLIHYGLPKLFYNDVSGVADIVFNNRFNDKCGLSINKCSFLYPRVNEIAANIRHLYENRNCDMLSMSSMGPAFFALTSNEKDEEICTEQFNKQDMNVFSVPVYNGTYKVKERI